MKLHQLRYINEVARRNLNISEAADALFTSQPGVSKQIRLLEEEIGVPIFLREGKRLTDITPAGEEILGRARNILREVENIKRIGEEYSEDQEGSLRLATTHTQARYALPRVIETFLKKYPKIKLFIKQGYPGEITQMVVDGEADMVIATEAVAGERKNIIAIPCYQWNRCALVLPGHPLLERGKVTLEDIASYPIVTYDFAFSGRTQVSETFKERGLVPNIVFTALDSDVIKTYVELGLGIGLVAGIAYDERKDKNLRMIDLSHLFKPSTTWIGIRRHAYLRSYMYDFIQEFSPNLNRRTVRAALIAG